MTLSSQTTNYPAWMAWSFRRVKEKQPNAFEILITAYANGEIEKHAKEIGIKDIIPKPFTSEDVETSLSRIIGKNA